MENVTYEAYRGNPAVREQLEREAREERRREADRLVVAPLMRAAKRVFAAMRPTAASTRKPSASFQA